MPNPKAEYERFMQTWEAESRNTARLLEALPASQYDYRPDMTGRSLGELAWHLAEIEAYMSFCITSGKFDVGMKPPGAERPREVPALATGYRRVHEEAVERMRKLKPDEINRKMKFFDGREMRIGDILWNAMLHHLIHHRGQLMLVCRLAGGKPPGLYGPTREEMAAMRAKMEAKV